MFGLTEASTSRRAVAVGRPIAVSSGSILVGKSFTIMGIIGRNSSRREAVVVLVVWRQRRLVCRGHR